MATNFSSLQTSPPDNSTTAGKSSSDWYSDHPNVENHLPGMIVLFIGFFLFISLCLLIGLRDHYVRKYGYDIWDRWGPRWRRWRRNNDQVESDRAMAEELQRRLNEDERETERLAKRKEREEWYSMYIQDFTMTAKAEDLFFAHESSSPASPSSESTVPEASFEETSDNATRKRFLSTSSLEEDLEDVEDLECGGTPTLTVHDPVACNHDEDDAHLYLRLPVKGADGHCRTVDAQCAICFSDYEQGDKIVWSGLQCQHAFHRDCIFPWLGKGKKRCPMCRHWFVPGAKIEDQKKALEERVRRQAESNTDSEIPNEAHQDETRVAAESPVHQQKKSSTTEIPSGDADATSTTEGDTTAESPSSSMSLDSGHESDESDHNHCHSNPSDPSENKDTSLRGRCETEEVTSEIYNQSIEAV